MLLHSRETGLGGKKLSETLSAWDLPSAQKKWTIRESGFVTVAWSADESQLLWSRQDSPNQVQRVSAEDGAVQSEWTMEGNVTGLAWSPSGKEWCCVLAVGDSMTGPISSKVELHGIDGKRLARFGVPDGCDGRYCQPEFSPDGRRLAWATYEREHLRGRIFLWDLEARELLTELVAHEHMATSLTWNRTGTRLASGSVRGALIWEPDSGMSLLTLSRVVTSPLRWSDSGRRLFGTSHTWDTSRGFDHATPLPSQAFKSLIRRSSGAR